MTQLLPAESAQAAALAHALYQRMSPLSTLEHGESGKVIALYLDSLGVLSVVAKSGSEPPELIASLHSSGKLDIVGGRALQREAFVSLTGGSLDMAEESKAGLPVVDELWIWRMQHHDTDPLPAQGDMHELELLACASLESWVVQDARSQGRPQPACWPLASKLLKASDAGVTLSQARVWAFLLAEVGLEMAEGVLDALGGLRAPGIPASLRVRAFTTVLRAHPAAVSEASLFEQLQSALNAGLLSRAVQSAQVFDGSVVLRYRIEDLLLLGLLPRANALYLAMKTSAAK